MAILQSTFTSKPCCKAIQSTYSAEVKGKGAHLQRLVPLQGLQTAIALKGELQNSLHLAAAIVPRRRGKLLCVNSDRSAVTGLTTISGPAILLFTSGLGQNIFHSRMPDAAFSLHPVWTMQMICLHRPY